MEAPLSRWAAEADGPELPEECRVFQVSGAEGAGKEGWRGLDAGALRGEDGARARRRKRRQEEELAAIAAEDPLFAGLLDAGRGRCPAAGASRRSEEVQGSH